MSARNRTPTSVKSTRNYFRRWRLCRFEPLEVRQVLNGSYGLPDGLTAYPQSVIAEPFQFTSPVGFTPTQIRQAYGFNNISFARGIKANGQGQTIAIVDAQSNPTIASDLKVFDQTFGIPDPPSFKIVNQNGSTNPATLPTPDQGWAQEITLDVEWAHAIAPGANILLVETTDLLSGVNYARRAPAVSVVSCSFGIGFGSLGGQSLLEFLGENTMDTTFTTPSGHPGVTFSVSAGDSGGPADWPSVSTNVLSVGGTTLNLTASNNWSSETVWNDSASQFGAGGGGQSGVIYTNPNTGINILSQFSPVALEPVPNFQSGLGLTTRGTPDVAYNADPNSGVAVYSSFAFGGWESIGGTSAGAPQWAGLLAIADQGRALIHKASLANAQAVVYKLPRSDFHDITVGNNDYFGQGLGITGNAAGPGYDLASGLGTPIANLVVRDLVAFSGSTVVTPSRSGVSNSTGTWYFFTKSKSFSDGSDSAAPSSTSISAPVSDSATNDFISLGQSYLSDSGAFSVAAQSNSIRDNDVAPMQFSSDSPSDTLHHSHDFDTDASANTDNAFDMIDGFFAQM